jgi:hypothetical protein
MGFWSNIFGKGGSYFLDDESAKTMGDTEYMKEVKTVRRTFPKSASTEGHFEMVERVSAMDKVIYDSRNPYGQPPASTSAASQASAAAPSAAPQASSASAASPEAQERRRVDTSMDMFRNMAKKVGK